MISIKLDKKKRTKIMHCFFLPVTETKLDLRAINFGKISNTKKMDYHRIYLNHFVAIRSI